MRSVCVRKAEESDRDAIADVVTAAFGPAEGPEIVQLIADLSADPSAQPILSLVAAMDDRVIGQVLFSSARVQTDEREPSATILAPLAVHPAFQSRGIGGQLITEGLRQLAEAGVEVVFVLGHPDYYPRFGFAEAGMYVRSSSSKIASPTASCCWRSRNPSEAATAEAYSYLVIESPRSDLYRIDSLASTRNVALRLVSSSYCLM